MSTRKNSVSLTIQYPSFIQMLGDVKATSAESVATLFSFANDQVKNFSQNFTDFQSSGRRKFSNKLPKFNKKNAVKYILPVVLVLIAVGIIRLALSAPEGSANGVLGSGDDRNIISVEAPLATQNLNRELSFPLKDSAGKTVSNFKYNILSAELRDEIIANGRKYRAVEGRQILVLNLKLVNDFNQGISINTRDYVRLFVNNNDKELFAPDSHNDPVEVQANSVEPTRIAFNVNSTDKDFTLRIGEINGQKQTIKLNLARD